MAAVEGGVLTNAWRPTISDRVHQLFVFPDPCPDCGGVTFYPGSLRDLGLKMDSAEQWEACKCRCKGRGRAAATPEDLDWDP